MNSSTKRLTEQQLSWSLYQLWSVWDKSIPRSDKLWHKQSIIVSYLIQKTFGKSQSVCHLRWKSYFCIKSVTEIVFVVCKNTVCHWPCIAISLHQNLFNMYTLSWECPLVMIMLQNYCRNSTEKSKPFWFQCLPLHHSHWTKRLTTAPRSDKLWNKQSITVSYQIQKTFGKSQSVCHLRWKSYFCQGVAD